jgi:hypothetical protein
MFTGLHPWEHGVTCNGVVPDERFPTVAERLQEAGFHTAGVAASFPMHSRFGQAQGLASFDERFSQRRTDQFEPTQPGKRGRLYSSSAEDVTQRALAALAALEGERQFLWVHYFDTHAPYGDSVGSGLSASRLTSAAQRQSPELELLVREARRLYALDAGAIDLALECRLQGVLADGECFEPHVLLSRDDGTFGHGTRGRSSS